MRCEDSVSLPWAPSLLPPLYSFIFFLLSLHSFLSLLSVSFLVPPPFPLWPSFPPLSFLTLYLTLLSDLPFLISSLLFSSSFQDASSPPLFLLVWTDPQSHLPHGAKSTNRKELFTVNYQCGHLESRQCVQVDLNSGRVVLYMRVYTQYKACGGVCVCVCVCVCVWDWWPICTNEVCGLVYIYLVFCDCLWIYK